MQVAVFGIVVALLGLGCPRDETKRHDHAPAVELDATRYLVELFGDDQAIGSREPLVTIVVFTDYACPPCGLTWQVMDNLVEDYGEDLRVVVRAYTVPGFGQGEQAAEAALAAGAQGKFWDMHRRLFAHPSTFDRPSLRAHAEALGLDGQRFTDELDTGAHAGTRIRHRREATRIGVMGLPTAFINGLVLTGFVDEESWHSIIDAEIRSVRAMLAEGTARTNIYATLMADASTQRIALPAGAVEQQRALAEKSEGPAATSVVAPQNDARYRIEPGDIRIGPSDAPVVVVAFMDFECPYCKRAWEGELAALAEARRGEVVFSIRHLPLAMHTAAEGAAKAAAAAQKQGAGWQFVDKLMSHQGPIGRSDFVAYAEALELDTAAFVEALDDPALAQTVTTDIRVAERVGVTGTPGFFVNGRYVRGYSPGQIAAMIDEEREHVRTLMRKGIAKAEVFSTIMNDAVQPSEFPNP
jgi:protein-disulfide isomerase